MRSRSLLFLSLSLLFFVIEPVRSQTAINLLNELGYNRIGSDFWASGGAGIAEPGLRTAAFANPALISFSHLTVTAETGWRPRTDYFAGLDLDNTMILPSYVSVGIPVGAASLEAGYVRSYDNRYYIGNILTTTQSQPDGPGTYGHVDQQLTIHTAFASLSYTPQEGYRFGLTAGLDVIRYKNDFSYFSGQAKGTRPQLAIGFAAQPFETVSFGLTVHASQNTPLDNSTNGPMTVYDSSTGISYTLAIPSYTAETPMNLEFGGAVDALPWLRLLGSAEYQHWSALQGSLRDVWQYHLGAVVTALPEATFRAGFFTQRSASTVMADYLNEYFLTAGASWRFSEDFTATVAYMTSSPFTKNSPGGPFMSFDKSLSQSMLSGGVSYSW